MHFLFPPHYSPVGSPYWDTGVLICDAGVVGWSEVYGMPSGPWYNFCRFVMSDYPARDWADIWLLILLLNGCVILVKCG